MSEQRIVCSCFFSVSCDQVETRWTAVQKKSEQRKKKRTEQQLIALQWNKWSIKVYDLVVKLVLLSSIYGVRCECLCEFVLIILRAVSIMINFKWTFSPALKASFSSKRKNTKRSVCFGNNNLSRLRLKCQSLLCMHKMSTKSKWKWKDEEKYAIAFIKLCDRTQMSICAGAD